MEKEMSLQCGRMALMAKEYCTFVDGFSHASDGAGWRDDWLEKLERLLPRLHVAVIALAEPAEDMRHYRFSDDDQRCELFLHLGGALQSDHNLWAGYEADGMKQQSPQELCVRMADNLTDIYFDLKHGLELVHENPARAASDWQCSFYAHWGKHLLDAECWLHAMDAGGEPPHLPEWRWPNPIDTVVGQDF